MVGSGWSSRKTVRFAALSPPTKLAIWIGAVVALAALIQAAAWVLGFDFSILHASGGGRGVLLALTLVSLLLLMAADGRPAADYGLVVAAGWQRRLYGGFLLGGAVHAAYWLAAVAAGGFLLHTTGLTGGRCARAALVSLSAFPVSLVQQIIFSGYLLSLLRDRYSRVTAVLVPAALFALLHRMDDPPALLSADSHPMLIGMFLLGVLLGLLRLWTGGILFPAGVLAGCIFVRRFLKQTLLVVPSAVGGEAIGWTAPWNHSLQGPAMWLVLALGILACGIGMWRRPREGREAPAGAPETDASFKRIFPFSNIALLAPLDVWLGRLIEARFRVGWRYLPRLLAILVFSSLNTVLSLPERLLAPLLLRRRRVLDPVFIVGVHRSGTTHMHNLLALDEQYVTPKAHQVLNPAGFWFLGWLTAPLLAAFLPWKRPMDDMRFHIFTPQEEEFALAGVTGTSPYWGLTFPRLWGRYDRFIFPRDFSDGELASWQDHLRLFLRKLVFWSGKRPLLKNPYNTGRVAVLRELFPHARFIHIYRHPYDVYRSNMHLAREGHIVHQLQDPDPTDNYETRFLANYRALEEAFYRDTAGLARNQVAEVAFEDLERDPVGELARIYGRLGLDMSPQFRQRLRDYLEGVADHQKNRFPPLADEVRRAVDAQMGPFLARWGYGVTGAVRKAA